MSLSDSQGNSLFQDVRFHGFEASPLQGVAQAIAVYQNGVRLNEAFGDTMNWDAIPATAIARMDVWSSNPVFGLNTHSATYGAYFSADDTVGLLNPALTDPRTLTLQQPITVQLGLKLAL